MEKSCIEKYAMDQLRLQRHDFMNYLQVIFGYIQLNKPDKAVSYIKNINKQMVNISRIYNLESDPLGLLFQDFIMKCSKFDLEMELEIGISAVDNSVVENNYQLFINLIDNFLEKLSIIEDNNSSINVMLKGVFNNFYIIISNSTIINSVEYHDFLYNVYIESNIAGNENYISFEEKDIIALIINFNAISKK